MSIWKFVFQNNSDKKKKNHFIKVKLKGRNQNKFKEVVELFSGDEIIRTELIPPEVFSLYRLCDDIWNWNKKIDSIQVIWPNSKFQTIKNYQQTQHLI
jgi:hypothetical protein